MHPDELFTIWKQRRASADAPADFADRVMASLPPRAPAGTPSPSWHEWFLALLESRLGRVGVCALACLGFALRMGSVIALFLEWVAKAEGAS